MRRSQFQCTVEELYHVKARSERGEMASHPNYGTAGGRLLEESTQDIQHLLVPGATAIHEVVYELGGRKLQQGVV